MGDSPFGLVKDKNPPSSNRVRPMWQITSSLDQRKTRILRLVIPYATMRLQASILVGKKQRTISVLVTCLIRALF
jgi:hypothetical protein